jgi:hypothetical protein
LGGDYVRLRLGSLILAFLASTSATASALPNATPRANTSETNDRIRAVVQAAHAVYVGGDFTQVDGTTRGFVARFDGTGTFVSSWRARTNGRVYALALSSDRSKLFIAGAFTRVNGVKRQHIAAVRAANGRLIRSWRANTDGAVRALLTRRGSLYLGGDFKTVRGKHRVRLAAVAQRAGGVSAWQPLANRAVRALAVQRRILFAGGDFTKVAGRSGTLVARDNLVAIDAQRGTIKNFNPGPGFIVNSIEAVRGTVYVATGGECGSGNCNSVLAYATGTSSLRWKCQGDGDVHSLERSGSVLYAGGHFLASAAGCLNSRELLAIDRTNGSVLPWTPHPNGFGVLALSAWRGSRLAVGGDFTRVSGVLHANYAQFAGAINSTT